MERRCKKCGRLLPLTAFGKDRRQADGLSIYCKECRKEYSRAYYASLSPEQRKERQRKILAYVEAHPDVKEKMQASAKRWREDNAERVAQTQNNYRRRRYASDPEYREKKKEYQRGYYARHKDDPEFKERDRKCQRKYRETHREYERQRARANYYKKRDKDISL